MKSHRVSIFIFFFLFLLTSSVALFTEYFAPQWSHKSFWQNILIGVWTSNFLVLTLECVNYYVAKSELLHQYVNEAQKLYNKILTVKEKSGQKSINLDEIILDLRESLDFTYLFDVYYKFSFIYLTKYNKHKSTIDIIQESLHRYHQNLEEFSQMYKIAPDEREKKRVLEKYKDFDRETSVILRKQLTTLRE